jgi:hypothetical protein
LPNRAPNVVVSSLSRTVSHNGVTVKVEIYRFEDETAWTLEVSNQWGASTLWETEFLTDEEANHAFDIALGEDGIETFIDRTTTLLDSDNVIPFLKRA